MYHYVCWQCDEKIPVRYVNKVQVKTSCAKCFPDDENTPKKVFNNNNRRARKLAEH
jgi:hypothetical protein